MIMCVIVALSDPVYRPTPDDCLSPFWAKAFPGHGDDISKDGPGGEKKVISPTGARKKAPMTLGLADKRIFVINNERVVEDGASIGRMQRSTGTTPKDDKSCLVSYHYSFLLNIIGLYILNACGIAIKNHAVIFPIWPP